MRKMISEQPIKREKNRTQVFYKSMGEILQKHKDTLQDVFRMLHRFKEFQK